ncbi:glutathione S-transferase [Athelia psychrophila]|uniref:glutathione transferase n=1 Tax=Athelia psychrophila TaxID=1759441 RepID=A0A166J971_9AGAM|nr:glutathione S-transferase [Fibularhizoctonia sp. CBS 109695]
MVLKLYGSPISTCTKRVAVVLKEKEKNVPFEFIAIDFRKGEHKAPDFVAKQPFGQVPFIDDDGFILYESRAIGRYIATKYASQGPALIPLGDLKANALFEQAASSEQANFDALAHVLSYEKWFKKMIGQEADEAVSKLGGKLDAYEVILSKQAYVAGNEVTLADLFHLPYGAKVKEIFPELFSSRPHVAGWFENLESRPSWQGVKDVITSSI